MSIYNRRNAAVGYLTLKAVQRAIDNKRRNAGADCGLPPTSGSASSRQGSSQRALAIALKRRHGNGDDAPGFEDENEIVGEYVTAPEPLPAT